MFNLNVKLIYLKKRGSEDVKMAKKLPNRDEVRKEIETKRNHSWFREVFTRHESDENKVVMKYLGTDITYQKFFDESVHVARALKAKGINKGDEFVACIDRTPEFAYLVGGASIVGAKIKLISDKFDSCFIKKIVNDANSKLFFVQDVKLAKLKNTLIDLPNNDIIVLSHERSLNKKYPFLEIFNHYYSLDYDSFDETYNILSNVDSYDNFIRMGLSYAGKVEEESTLDDVFTITYSSGTTKKGFPKGIVHTNRHYILMGRYHDSEVSGIPSMKELSTYSNIPVYSNSYVSSSFSDNLIQGGVVVLDPVDDPEYFLLAVRINNSNMNIATTSTWLLNAINYYRCCYNYKLPYALFNFAAGEQTSPGEEKFLNKFFRDVKAGTKLTHTPITVAKLSTAGSDCEHGSLFIRIFREYFNKMPNRLNRSEPIGMKGYDFVDVVALRDNGTYALPYEYGRLVCNSGCTMKEYDRNPEATKEFFVKDAYGKTWGDMNVHGYLDEKGNITMKGRIDKNKIGIPNFFIADEISRDTKNIMSCEVVSFEEYGNVTYVAHVKFQLHTSRSFDAILMSAVDRCVNRFGDKIMDNLCFRVHDFCEDFPLTISAKRDVKALEGEGMSEVITINDLRKNSTKSTLLKSRKK